MTVEYNRRAIERHIELLTRPWIEDGLSALLEIRCLQDRGHSKSLYVDQTDADFLDDAITKVCDLNQAGWNAYICVNPMDNTNVGPANDGAILGAYFVFADADDGEASKQLLDSNVQPDFYVQTGSTPTQRLHAYWRDACILILLRVRSKSWLANVTKCFFKINLEFIYGHTFCTIKSSSTGDKA